MNAALLSDYWRNGQHPSRLCRDTKQAIGDCRCPRHAPSFVVQYREANDWVDCVREDLAEALSYSGNYPKAEFPTRAEAEAFILTLCGLMHCGGDPKEFRVEARRG